jgi:hypothetical protein
MTLVKNIRYVTINRSCNEPQEWRYDEWNCNYCGNDHEYYQPYNDTDIIYIQSWFKDVVSADPSSPTAGWYDASINDWYIRARIRDYSGVLITETPSEFILAGGVGYVDNKSFQNIQIDPNTEAMAGVDCFYVEFEVITTPAVGSTEAEVEIYRTEPYKRITCEQSFLIEGIFTSFDSICNFYDISTNMYVPGTDENQWLKHRDRYRVLGNYEFVGTSNTCNLVGDGTQSQDKSGTIRKNVYRLRTRGIPPYVAERMANSITGDYFVIDDCISVICHGGLEKNNELGTMWYIDTQIEQTAAEVKHSACNQ